MQNAMAGPSDRDLDSLPSAPLPVAYEPITGARVAWSLDLGYHAIDAEVAAAFHAALDLLRDLGCILEPVELGWSERVREAYELHHAAADAAALWMLLPSQRDELTDYALAEIERGNAIRARDVLAVHEVRAAMYAELGPILARCDVFACPTTAVPAVAADHSPVGDDLVIAGRRVPAHRGWVLTYPFNMLGALPVLSVPIARAASGVPIGLQLVARPYDGRAVFRAGAALERARGAWYVDDATRPLVDRVSSARRAHETGSCSPESP
jgi:amidase